MLNELERLVLAELRKYSEDQPRDEAGRWTGGGLSAKARGGFAKDPREWSDDERAFMLDMARKAFPDLTEEKELIEAYGRQMADSRAASDAAIDSDKYGVSIRHRAYYTANGRFKKALIELLKYSEDQPRDEAGRWTSGGGAALASSGTSMETHAAIAEQLGTLNSKLSRERLADISPDILAQADADTLTGLIEVDNGPPNADDLPPKVEPELTEETKAIASDLADDLLVMGERTRANVNGTVRDIADALGGTMHGLQYEMKDEESLERKLGQQIELAGMTPEQAFADMKDVVRYTVVFPPDGFADGAASLIEQFKAAGFEPLKSKLTFGATYSADDEAKSAGNVLAGELVPGAALNTAWMDTKTGLPFEIQVHTPDSVIAKTLSHEYYSVERVLPESDPLNRQLNEKMIDLASMLEAPPNLDQVPTYRYVP